jgi:hypothetical protein
MKRWHNLLPLLVSAGLIAWLLQRVPLASVLAAAAHLRWQLLAPATAAMVLGLFFWDGVCLRLVYSTDHAPLGYRRMLQVRGMSYLFSAVHCQLGQAMVIWNVARLQGSSLITTFSRSLLLLYHDAFLLMSAGLIGSLLSDRPLAVQLRVVCGAALALLAGGAGLLALLPASQRNRFQQTRWGAWLDSWTWRRSLRLLALRTVYYAILGLYATLALRICRLGVDYATILSTIPLVLVADTLPSISGLGTRETALYVLLGPEHQEVLLAMGLFWSMGIIFGRLAIGLVHLWFCREVLQVPNITEAPPVA